MRGSERSRIARVDVAFSATRVSDTRTRDRLRIFRTESTRILYCTERTSFAHEKRVNHTGQVGEIYRDYGRRDYPRKSALPRFLRDNPRVPENQLDSR